jgi:D-lactate dehydrogenase (cytochrome)
VDLSAYLVAQHGVALFISGPVTLGALDVRVQANPEHIEAWDGALDVRDHLMEVAADKGGASSAGQGVGLDGRRYMKREHGLAIKIMGQLKAALDPAGILNPGKILP